MRVLVIGTGAREHALAWALARDPETDKLICAPGNPGTAQLATNVPVEVSDPSALLALAERESAGLTVVGPEVPLAAGVADRFAAAGRLLIGPTRVAAELESSKAFAKEFMARRRIPTARHRLATSADEAKTLLSTGEFGFPVVLKADGLAAGKGVVVAPDRQTALAAVEAMMVERRFGAAGARIVVEEYLEGREASFFVLTDGTRVVTLPSAEDHKRALDGDRGPNTGGMGAFAPSPLIDEPVGRRVLDEIVLPTLDGMRAEGREYRGFLYVGLMITRDGPKVVEFNVRLGDPETQVVLPMIEGRLLPLFESAARGRLVVDRVRTSADSLVGVVLASRGYPDHYEKGKPIAGLDEAAACPGALVFHAGTAVCDGRVVTAGGRVVTVVGRGATLGDAIGTAYGAAAHISFEGLSMRRDIGAKALEAR